MKIRMLTAITGQWVANRGEEVDRPDKEAERLIEAGFAEAVEPSGEAKTKAKTKAKDEGAAAE